MGTEGSLVAKVERPVLLHPVLSQEQALIIHQCLIHRNSDPEPLSELVDEEQRLRREIGDLTTFFSHAVERPEDFPLRSKDDNKRLLRSLKPVKGEAQPKSRRKRRQRPRMSYAKRTRAQKRAEAEEYNRARQIMEDEQLEAQDDYQSEIERRKARFESIAMKETVTNDELQEVLELFGAPPEVAERVRELRAADDPQARLAAAAERSRSGAEGAGATEVGAAVREGG